MGLDREEILNYASRYVTPDKIIDFPMDGEVFALLVRIIPTDKVLQDEEGWEFGGYGLCIGYKVDEDSKPMGKWLWMHFMSLDRFPPSPQVVKLQPPHVVKGRFQNPERTHEIRVLKLTIGNSLQLANDSIPKEDAQTKVPAQAKEEKGNLEEKVIPFRRKGQKSKK